MNELEALRKEDEELSLQIQESVKEADKWRIKSRSLLQEITKDMFKK